MNAPRGKNNPKILLPALAAVGGACGLLSAPAAALELGDVRIDSTLGQPLRASIAYALNPNEELYNFCIYLRSGVADSGLQYLSRARIRLTDSTILLTSEAPIREPMLAMQVSVSCPYTAHLARNYTLMIDPARPAEIATPQRAAVAPASAGASTAEGRAARNVSQPAAPVSRQPADTSPVSTNDRYQVQPGDSLSTIVSRIQDRPSGLWRSVDRIFAANPHAFIDGDRNLIKAGTWLDIPDLFQAATGPVEDAPRAADVTGPAAVAEPAIAAPAEEQPTAYSGYEPIQSDEFDSGYMADESPLSPEIDPIETDVDPIEADVDLAEAEDTIRPGDVFVGSDSPFVSPIASSDDAEDPAAAVTDTAPSRSVPVVNTGAGTGTSGATSDSWSWLIWLGGSGIAIILGLLLFGRRMRERFGSAPIGPSAAVAEERRKPESVSRPAAASDVDFQFDTNAATGEALTLDADLGAGTGLQEGTEIDVAQDFGFSATGDLEGPMDLEIPEHAAEDDAPAPTTEIIPPNRVEESSILESEVPPAESDDSQEYDLSMIVDATKQSLDQTDLTAADLNAVQVESAEPAEGTGGYTMSNEVDYKVLEQDYEEELTATQALNEEIAKAAVELAATMDPDIENEETAEVPAVNPAEFDTDVTHEMPSAKDPETTAEITAELPSEAAAGDDMPITDLDDTGVNEELTAEMPSAENDPTVEMDVEGGRVDTKKSVG